MKAPLDSRADEDARLAARAVELARPHGHERQQETVDVLVLMSAGQRVVVPVQEIREVRPPGPLAQLPGGNAVLVGLISAHGDVLVAASLAALLGLRTTVAAHDQWVAVVHHATAPVGLLADSAVDIVPVSRDDLQGCDDSERLLAGMLRDGSLLVRPDVLLRDPRLVLRTPAPTQENPWPER